MSFLQTDPFSTREDMSEPQLYYIMSLILVLHANIAHIYVMYVRMLSNQPYRTCNNISKMGFNNIMR